MKRVLCLLLCCSYVLGYGQFEGSTTGEQEKVASSLAATITVSELKNHLTTIASAEFEGRETGTEGQKKAANYIASYFEELGLPAIGEDDTYFQKISFIAENWNNIELNVNGESKRHMWDYYAYPANNSDRPMQDFKEVVFLGYGIDDPNYSDYKNANVEGKAILIYAGEPMGKDSLSHVSGKRGATDWSTDIYKKLRVAKDKGVAMVFIIDTDFKNNVGTARRTILNRRLKMGWSKNPADNFANNVFISSKVAKEIIGKQYKKVVKARKKINKKKRAKRVKLPTNLSITMEKNVRQLLGENVLGFVEGSDPTKKDEVVVVTAHYDHLGKRGDAIYYGA
ncbi:MAG: peptidase M28, partial [Saprospiraceae bacterium]|nr:peptidase M28 [Saprospiraceae bacterium]